MSMVPLGGLLSSTAGTALSQTSGSESERTQKDTLTQRRGVDADLHAERSSGIGQTEQDQQSSERDADGRRLWENPAAAKKGPAHAGEAEIEVEARQSKDATGQSGTQLDLTG
jgi:hypothetical protein